ncbi:hypothetical protein MJH12_07445 [bacterium]|nr:hypothetical protein [bacterium]
MAIDTNIFEVDLEVIEEKLKALHEITLSLINFFRSKSIDSIISMVETREGVIQGFLKACARVDSKLRTLDSGYKERPLSFLQEHSEGPFRERIIKIIDQWAVIVDLENKVQDFGKSLPKLMKENLKTVQQARPALKAYSTIADVINRTDPRFERKK